MVNDLNSVREIQNCIGTIKEVIRFFRESTLRRQEAPSLPLLSETRWSEKYKSIRLFSEHFVAIKRSLEAIAANLTFNKTSRIKAQQLNMATSDVSFFLCLQIIAKYSSLLEPVVNVLQGKSIDLLEVKKHISNLVEMFQNHRSDEEVDERFHVIYESAKTLAETFDIEFKIPRIAGHQIHRANYQGSVEEYYRRSLFITYLDSLITSLHTRFSEENTYAFMLYQLHPCNLKKYKTDEFGKLVEGISNYYEIDNFKEQAHSWYYFWTNQNEISVTRDTAMIELLEHCQFYPAVGVAIEIAACLPPITCTVEKSFSRLRRIKTWIRNTISANRLDGLSMMSVHRDYIKNNKDNLIEKVINEFGKTSRNLTFLFSDQNL